MFGTPIPTLLSFLPLPTEFVGTDGVRQPHKFSLFDRFPFCHLGMGFRSARLVRAVALLKKQGIKGSIRGQF